MKRILLWCLLLTASALRPAHTQQPAATKAATTSPAYKVVLSRAAMRIAVISPKDRTPDKLRALCQRLKTDFAAMPIVLIMVFDDPKAAAMYDRMVASGGSLGEATDTYYDQHTVANYSRNRNTGHNQYTYWPQGGRARPIDSSC